MSNAIIEDDHAKFSIKEGIVYAVYKEGLAIDIAVARKIVSDRVICQNNEAYPVFADYRGLKVINKEAREYLAKEGSQFVMACAVLIDSLVHKTMANFYLALNKPSIPTRLFTDKQEALNWLEQYKGHQH